jgi:DNA polymerase-3 subunit gamma/tau
VVQSAAAASNPVEEPDEAEEPDSELETAAPWDNADEADDALPAYAMAEEAELAEPAYQFDGDWGALVSLLGTRWARPACWHTMPC